jgi:putative salt-induced outer membrane protein YdiY
MPHRSVRAVIILLVLLLSTPARAQADEVQLSNGDRITGRLVSLANGTLRFATPYGDLGIPWNLVSSLAVDTPIVVTTGTQPPTTAARAAGTAAAGLALDPAGRVSFPEITSIARPEPPVTIDGSANAGLIRSGGNSDANTVRLDTDLGIRAGDNRYTASAVVLRSQDRGLETARNWSTSLKYDRFLTTRLFVNANALLTSDRFRELDLRTALGAGLGYQVFDGPRVKLTADGGFGWVDENLRLQPGDRYTAARESAALDLFIVLPDRVQLFHKHDGYFGVTGDDNMFVRTQNGVRVGLGGGFVTTTRVDVDYDRTPAPGRQNVDRTFAITLGYQF